MQADRPQRVDLTLAAIMALATFVRLATLTNHPLWFDESVLVAFAQLDSGNWLDYLERHLGLGLGLSKSPLVIIALRGWIALLGDSLAALRSLFALAGVASVWLLYLLGDRLLGRRGGVLAALLLAISPFHGHFSQQICEYGFLLLAGLCSMLLWVDHWHQGWRPGWRTWAVPLLNLLSLGIHPLAVFVPGIQLLAGLLLRRGCWRAAGWWLNLVPLALLGLHSVWATSQRQLLQAAAGWIPPLSLSTAANTLRELGHGVMTHGALADARFPQGFPLTLSFLAAGSFGLALLGALDGCPRQIRRLLLAWLLAPAAALALISLGPRSLWVTRYMIIALPALYLLAAAGLGWLFDRRAPLGWLALAALAGLTGGALLRQNAPARGTMEQLVQQLEARMLPGDGVLVSPESILLPLGYYRDRRVDRWLLLARRQERRIQPGDRWLSSSLTRPTPALQRRPDFLRWLRGHRRIWLVVLPDWPGDLQTPALLRHLRLDARLRQADRTRYAFSEIQLVLFVRRPGEH